MRCLVHSQEPRIEGFTHTASVVAERINLGRFFPASKEGGYEAAELYSRSQSENPCQAPIRCILRPHQYRYNERAWSWCLLNKGLAIPWTASAKRRFELVRVEAVKPGSTNLTWPWFRTQGDYQADSVAPGRILSSCAGTSRVLPFTSIRRPYAMQDSGIDYKPSPYTICAIPVAAYFCI
jgi:hypothetical protein